MRTILGIAVIFISISVMLSPSNAFAPVKEDSGDVYLKPLPYIIAKPTCNCLEFARQLGVGDTKVDSPVILGGVLLNEGTQGHIAVVLEVNEEDILIIESNYVHCQITMRRLSLNYKRIRGFVE